MANIYEEEVTLDPIFEKVLSYTEFKPLVDEDLRFKLLAKIKLDKNEDEVETGGAAVEIKKVPALYETLTNFDYIILVCRFRWNNMAQGMQEASLHKALMTIEVDLTGKEVKYNTRPPDVNEFSETINRFGLYNEAVKNLGDLMDEVKREIKRIRTVTQEDADE